MFRYTIIHTVGENVCNTTQNVKKTLKSHRCHLRDSASCQIDHRAVHRATCSVRSTVGDQSSISDHTVPSRHQVRKTPEHPMSLFISHAALTKGPHVVVKLSNTRVQDKVPEGIKIPLVLLTNKDISLIIRGRLYSSCVQSSMLACKKRKWVGTSLGRDENGQIDVWR